MRKLILGALLGMLLALPAAAQRNTQAANQNPLSTWLRNAYKINRNFLVQSAEKMPEQDYNMRPGPQMVVRTYGQIIGHLANFNYLWCSEAQGKKNPAVGKDFEKVTTKAGLVQALQGALHYCDGVYDALTDASGMQMIEVTTEGGRKTRMPRFAQLILNYAHNNDHYGNLVTYMRIKSIVPPSTARASQSR